MKPCVHGGGILRAARELGWPPERLRDFSASINPLGIPPAVKAAAQRGLELSLHYPEADAGALRRELAAAHSLPEAAVLPGAGATELLYRLFRVLGVRRALIVRPAFGEYARAVQLAGGEAASFDLHPEDGFALDPQVLLRALTPSTDWLVLANPGNPTGAGIPPAVLRALLAALPAGVRLLVDEAFADFCPSLSLLPDLSDGRLLVLRSLTKFYAMPGLRVGWLAGPAADLAALAAAQEPWLLSTPAQEAARACLAQEDFRRETLAVIPRWREQLAGGLAALGCRPFPAAANYLLAQLPPGVRGAWLAQRLYRQGLLIRSCATFTPLDDGFIRLAVRAPDDNKMLLAALAALLKENA